MKYGIIILAVLLLMHMCGDPTTLLDVPEPVPSECEGSTGDDLTECLHHEVGVYRTRDEVGVYPPKGDF